MAKEHGQSSGGIYNGNLRRFENPVNQENGDLIGFIEDANQKLRENKDKEKDQAGLVDMLLKLGPLDLKFHLTASFVALLEDKLNYIVSNANSPQNHLQTKLNDFGSQPISEKLKASNFPALLLRIGSWERESKYEGDLVAKCYFAKKKLVWEFLERGLKNKVEIQWSDIIAIKAVIKHNEPGILEIELNQPPSFHMETDPQPRKHTIWKATTDFTGGHATLYRRHYLVFPVGSLDRHYEKLLQCEPRLLKLSQQPFPSMQSPFFHPTMLDFMESSFDHNVLGQEPCYGQQFSFSSIPSPLVTAHPFQSYALATHQPYFLETSPISVMDFSHSDEHMSNKVFENPRMRYWGQRMNNQVQRLLPAFPLSQVNPAIPGQNYNLQAYDQGDGVTYYEAKLLNALENNLLSGMQEGNYDKNYHMARVASLNALLNHCNEESPASKNDSQQTFCGQRMDAGENFVLGSDEHAHVNRGQFYQQPVACIPPQNFAEIPMMYQHCNNNLSYTSVTPDPTLEDFGPVDTEADNGINHWN